MARRTFTVVSVWNGSTFKSEYEHAEMIEVFGADVFARLMTGETVDRPGRNGGDRVVLADALAARALGIPFVA